MRVRGEEPDATTWPVPEMEESDRLVEADYRKSLFWEVPVWLLGYGQAAAVPLRRKGNSRAETGSLNT